MRASDSWSPIADVTWRYGDGTTERGTSVRHAYSRAGSFHVTVIVHDAAGNAAQRTFVVVASPLASAATATATVRGLSVGVTCMPSSPSVTGTVTAAIPGAKIVPFRCSVPGTRHRARAGQRVRAESASSCA